MPITRNFFANGMNQDLAKTKIQQNTYTDALNIRLVTDTGQSTAAVANVRGNDFLLSIPDTGNFVKVVFNPVPPLGIVTAYTVTINTIVDTFNYSGVGNVYDEFATFLNSSGFYASLNLSAYSYSRYVGLYSTSYLTLSLTIVNTIITNIVNPLTNLEVIGYTTIRDEIILLTCNQTSPSGSNPSQIWRLTYDKKILQTNRTLAVTFVLLYNNKLDFSKEFPVAPGAIQGNFENDDIKRIYWCNYRDSIKSFNTADPDGFFLDPTVFDNTPTQNTSIGILQRVNQSGGSLPYGIYNYSYRLSNNVGTTTRFKPLSNPLHIVAASEDSTAYVFYPNNTYNNSTNTGKSVSLLISDIDTDFDNIEIVYTRRTTYTNVPTEIFIIGQAIPINKTTGILNFTHFGGESLSAITIDELINPNLPPDVCKTMTAKDNMLLIGNIKTSTLDLTNFDSRVYRYPKSSTTAYSNVDDINPNQDSRNYNNYLYQYNSTKLGGTGVNISYEFVIEETHLDNSDITSGTPYKKLDNVNRSETTINLGVAGQIYPMPGFFNTPNSPYVESVLRGYQRDETYRFFITFFDMKGNPCWSKWIADIRMPSIYMPNTASGTSTDRSLQYPLIRKSGVETYGENLGIKFTVNTSAVSDQVSGYSITRVKREQKDKTVLATGILKPAFLETDIFLQQDTFNTNPITANSDYDRQYASILSPETFFRNFGDISRINGDFLEFIDFLNEDSSQRLISAASAPLFETKLIKSYSSSALTLNNTYQAFGDVAGTGAVGRKFAVNESTYIPAWIDILQPKTGFGPITNVYNINKLSQYTNSTGTSCQGGAMFSMVLATSGGASEGYNYFGDPAVTFKYVNNDGYTNSSKRYLVAYKRVVNNQYGGNTIAARSENETILCNHYQPVISGINTYSSNVFGGDTFVDIFDQYSQRKAWITTGSVNPDPLSTKIGVADLFPCESCININMRSKGTTIVDSNNPTINTRALPDGGTNIDIFEDANYNIMFSNENDIMKFLPKPVPFVEQNVFDHRVYSSDTKIDGELVDSWRNFKTTNYRDVDSSYGPINNIATLQNKLFYWQDRGFGVIPVNRRVLLPSSNSTELQLGTGLTLEKHEYISNKIGCKHQWSILGTDRSFYWYDVLSNKQIEYGQNGVIELSDIYGMHSFLENNINLDIINNDNPILNKGVISVYDYKYNEVIFTFLDGDGTIPYTLSYNEKLNFYTSFYSFTPNIYITDKYTIISANPYLRQDLFVHDYGQYGRFYNQHYPSSIKFITNEHPETTKVFNNIILQSEVQINNVDTASGATPVQETIDQIIHSNDYQNTGGTILTVGNNIKRKFRTWRLNIDRDMNTTELISTTYKARMRDKYLSTEMTFINNNNKRIIIHDVLIGYNIATY